MDIDRLYLGDCLRVMPTLPAGSIDAVITDIPYGTTNCKWDSVIPLVAMWESVWHVLKRNGVFVTTCSQPFTSTLIMSQVNYFRYCWVWEKNRVTRFLDARRRPLLAHEDIAIFYREQSTYNPQKTAGKANHSRGNGAAWKESKIYKPQVFVETDMTGMKYPRTVQHFDVVPPTGRLHATQKPVDLYEYLIQTYTHPGETVLDLAMGTGTTGVACRHTQRHFIGIEIDPAYFNVAQRQIETETVVDG